MAAYFGNLEQLTLQNSFFRQVLFTGNYCQLVLMCLQPNEEIGSEVHANVDQFFRIEEGEAKFVIGEGEEHIVKNGEAAIVPAGTQHNVINTSGTAMLKLYTVYSPPNHPEGTIHKTKAEAMGAEHEEPTITAAEPVGSATVDPVVNIDEMPAAAEPPAPAQQAAPTDDENFN